jgi:hypothetical protein
MPVLVTTTRHAVDRAPNAVNYMGILASLTFVDLTTDGNKRKLMI